MKQLLWKELRENLKWALLGFLFVYFMLNYSSVKQGFFFEDYSTLHTFSFTAVFLGFALGLLQVYTESAPDRWAFLMHRSTSARQIVLSKVIVGISLMAVIWMLVVLLAIFQLTSLQWLQYPMYWFRPIPALIATLVGIPAYLSGLMFIVWKPRWKFARPLLLGLVVLLCFIIPQLMGNVGWSYLWVVALICFLCSIYMLYAVFDIYQTSGEQARAGKLSRVTTLCSSATGVAILLMFSFGFLLEPIMRSRSTNIKSATLRIGANGEIYQVVKRYDSQEQKYLIDDITNIEDPNDKPLQEEIQKGEMSYSEIVHNPQFAEHIQPRSRFHQGLFRFGKFEYVNLSGVAGTFMVSNYERLLLQYDNPQYRERYVLTGRIGKNGFSKPYEQKPERFGKIVRTDQANPMTARNKKGKYLSISTSNDRFLLICSDAIYKIVPKSEKVEKIYSAPSGKEILNVGHFTDDQEPVYVIEYADSFRVFAAIEDQEKRDQEKKKAAEEDDDRWQAIFYLPGKELGVIPKTGGLRTMTLGDNYDRAAYYLPRKKSLVFVNAKNDMGTEIVEANFQGKISPMKYFNAKELRLGSFEPTPLFIKIPCLIFPVVFWVPFGGSYLTTPGGFEFIVSMLREESLFVAIFFVCLVATIIFGQWYCRTRRLTSRQKGRCFWATLLFGPAGLIAFWMIEEPPFLEPCAKCGKRMSVRADVCPACGTARGPLPEKERNIIAEELTLPHTDSIGARTAAEIVPS